MADTIPMDGPDAPRPGEAGLSDSTRKCPGCGVQFSGVIHEACPGNEKTVKDPGNAPSPPPGSPPSAGGTLDDLPEEASALSGDPARALHHYILVKQVGKGGMGAVWKAWDRKLTRWVAIKFLLVEDRDAVNRFGREAKLAARLRHPNIAAIYEVGEAPSREAAQGLRHYLAMEYIDGSTLASTGLTRPQILDLFIKVARAIDSAHRGGVIHRDLKPANIMLTRERWPYVMDFGLAKALETDSSLSVSGSVIGTPAYMPPEQAEGRLSAIDARSDIYSLGATFYTVLLGRPPFDGQSVMEILRKVSTQAPPAPRSIDPQFPAELERILLRAMARAPEERYPTALALAEDLARLQEGGGLRELPPPPEPLPAPMGPAERSGSSSRGFWVAAVLALLLGAGWLLRPQLLHLFPAPVPLPAGPGAQAPPSPTPPAPRPPERPPDPLPGPGRRPVPYTSPSPLPVPVPESGVFTLQVAVHPYAELVSVLCDGAPVPLGATSAPLRASGLRIGSYEIVLRHPRWGERTVKIHRSQIRPGKTLVVWGLMEQAELGVKELP